MEEEIFIISLVGIVFGTALVGFIFWNIFNLIKRKIDSSSNSSDLDPQFFKALAEFKRNTEKRLHNLEAIATNDDDDPININEDPTGSIEIEDDEVREEPKKSDNNLRNMLNE